MTDNFKFIFS